MLEDMSVSSTGGRRGHRSAPARFSFWIDHAGTLGPTLLRYDLRGRGVRRGARLGIDGRWHASTQPDSLLWLHTGSGDPIDIDEAREVARQLGFPDLDVTDPVVLP
jgi:hypothetical protein